MAVVKENGITKRLEAEIERMSSAHATGSARGTFSASELFGCSRRAVLSSVEGAKRRSVPSMSDWQWRYAFYRLPMFDVEQEFVPLGDTETKLSAVVDMIATYNREMMIVNFREREDLPSAPLVGDVTDMVVSMYLSGIWFGLLLYHCGTKYSCFFINPDRKECRAILGGIADKARKLADHILHETTPSGETGRNCSSCPFRGSCDSHKELPGVTADNEGDQV